MIHEVYSIGGMSCASCAASVERVTRAMPGVEESSVNLTTEKLSITYDPEQINAADIIAKVTGVGFTVELISKEGEKVERAETSAAPVAGRTVETGDHHCAHHFRGASVRLHGTDAHRRHAAACHHRHEYASGQLCDVPDAFCSAGDVHRPAALYRRF
jgi:cation transport ATPase